MEARERALFSVSVSRGQALFPLLIYFLAAALGLCCCEQRAVTLVGRGAGFALWWLLLLLWRTGLTVPQHVESPGSGIELASCIGRQILSRWTTREVQQALFLQISSDSEVSRSADWAASRYLTSGLFYYLLF